MLLSLSHYHPGLVEEAHLWLQYPEVQSHLTPRIEKKQKDMNYLWGCWRGHIRCIGVPF
jgi:hypothetical protein